MTATVYVLLTPIDPDAGEDRDLDLEVFSQRPTFTLTESQRLFVANIDGGDSNEITPELAPPPAFPDWYFTADTEQWHDEMREVNDYAAKVHDPDLGIEDLRRLASEAVSGWAERLGAILP